MISLFLLIAAVRLLPAGETTLTHPIEVGPRDSGLVVRGAEDGSTVLSGGIHVTGWTDRGDGVWGAKAPYTEILFVNGRRASRARFPDTGYFRLEENALEEECGESRTKVRQLVKMPSEVAAKLDGMPREEWPRAQLCAHTKWSCFRYPIVDYTNGTVTVHGKHMPKYLVWTPEMYFYLEGVRSAFDAPGEWFYDGEKGEILYRPLPGEIIRSAVIPVNGLETLLNVNGAENVTFENITFVYGDATRQKGPTWIGNTQSAVGEARAVVMVDNSTNIVFRNCRFTKIGSYGVWFNERVRGGGVFDCEFTDIGAGGVRIGPLTRRNGNESSFVSVENCLIADGGKVHPAGVGVLINHASDCRVVHNEIRDLFYTGVSVGWVWGYADSVAKRNEISFNYIHDIGKADLADMGGVYTLGRSEGTVVSNNVIHSIHSNSYGGWGLYNDEGSSDIVLENNLVYDTDDASYHQHYGRDNILRNNILIDSKAGQIAITKAEPHRSGTYERNIILWSEGDAFVRYNGVTKETANVDWRSNLWWRVDGVESFNGGDFQSWCKRVGDIGSCFADPGFADWKTCDFRLGKDSPALMLGFVPFDPSLAGRILRK